MTTMTVQIPSSQVEWFEQMLRTMGWVFRKEDTPDVAETEKTRVFETEIDELLTMFNTDKNGHETEAYRIASWRNE